MKITANLLALKPYLLDFVEREALIKIELEKVLKNGMNESRRIIKDMVDRKVELCKNVHWTSSDVYDWIVDGRAFSRGTVIGFAFKDYETVVASDGVVKLLDKKTHSIHTVFEDGYYYLEGIKFIDGGLGTKGHNNHPAIQIGYEDYTKKNCIAKKNIKKQYIIKGMTEGYTVLLAMGNEQERVMDLHHMVRGTQFDNSDANTVLLFKEEHRSLPSEIK